MQRHLRSIGLSELASDTLSETLPFESAYIGSANLTGAGIGMKSSNRRNFEAGILTDEASLIDAACEQFDSVWRGEHCTRCGRRQYRTDPIK